MSAPLIVNPSLIQTFIIRINDAIAPIMTFQIPIISYSDSAISAGLNWVFSLIPLPFRMVLVAIIVYSASHFAITIYLKGKAIVKWW